MSRFDELIAELCPDGVEYREIGSILNYEQPTKYLVASKNYSDEFATPVLTAGKTFILGYTSEEDGIYPSSAENPVIIFDDFTTDFKWVDFPFKAKSSGMKMLTVANKLETSFRYVYYAMQMIPYVPLDHKRHWISEYSHFEIPVPPIEVQREIVRILDAFAELTTELTTELTCRKQQYAYYRDQLLSRESLESLDGKLVEMKRLGDVSDTLTGFPFKSKEFKVSGIKVARGINVKRGSMIFDDDNTVCWKSSDGLEKYILNGGDILIAMDGSLVGKSFGVIAESDLPAILGQRVTRVRCSEIDPRFVFHIIASGTLEAMVDKKKTAGAVPHVSLKDIQAIEIPIPSLATQRKVVDILDRFDALTTSLTDGIPAEIEARRQQYEYYRDRLLDLPRKDADAT